MEVEALSPYRRFCSPVNGYQRDNVLPFKDPKR
jgi:hypothetical protein